MKNSHTTKLALVAAASLAAGGLVLPGGCGTAMNDPLGPPADALAALNAIDGAKPADVPADSVLVYSFNLIGYPAGHAYDGNCGDGHRIFVNRDDHSATILVVDDNTGWSIEDCNATAGHQAILHTDGLGLLGPYDVYVRILGAPGGTLHICADYVSDLIADCSLGTIDLTRNSGRSKFTLKPDSIFDASLENILWTVDTNTRFRIAQFRVYQQQ